MALTASQLRYCGGCVACLPPVNLIPQGQQLVILGNIGHVVPVVDVARATPALSISTCAGILPNLNRLTSCP